MIRRTISAYRSRLLLWRLSRSGRVSIGEGVLWKGRRFQISAKGKIYIEDGVVLNSKSEGYHANMACGVKLVAGRPDAVIRIGKSSRLNGASIHAWKNVDIGENCLFAAGVQIMDSNGHKVSPDTKRTLSKDEPRTISIGNDVWLGLNVVVLPGSRIGDNVVVGANTVISGEVPSNTIVRTAAAEILPLKRR